MFLCRAATIFLFLLKVNCDDDCATPNNGIAQCIPTSSNHMQSKVQPSFPKLLRTERYCGKQHSDDYFHTTNETIINEFPWLAALVSVNLGVITNFRCGGALINHRYVLTSALCVTGSYKATLVRLGEYHASNETDCIEDADMYECSDATEEVGIEKLTVHPDFDEKTNANNIALVRLNKTILYSDYIRPICLPIPGSPVAQAGDIVVTTGWGTQNNFYYVNVKTKMYSRIISDDECELFYSSNAYKLKLNEKDFCTAFLANNTQLICQGSAGGPVMSSRRNRWQMEGIISLGPRNCLPNHPVISLKMANFLDWIEYNIEM